jgi:Ni/Co efflux regulator RcnB
MKAGLMTAGKAIAIAALAALGFSGLTSEAFAKDRWDRDRDRRHRHHDRWEDWDNRRDARRAGVIAGSVAAGIAGSAARENAKDNYEECMVYYSYNDRYDRYCREQYYYDSASARRAARRTGVVVGLGVREIVRD